MRLENAKISIAVELHDDLRHRHIEAFMAAKRELDGTNAVRLSSPEHNGNIVRAALRCGIITEAPFTVEQVGDLTPPAVRWLGKELDAYLAKVLEISPK